MTASKQLLPRQALDQPNPLGRTGPVASHHLQAQRTAQGIAKCMDVGGRPTAKEAGRWKFLFLLPGARLVCLARGRFQHQRLVAGLLQSEKKCFAMPPLVPAGRALVHTPDPWPWAMGQGAKAGHARASRYWRSGVCRQRQRRATGKRQCPTGCHTTDEKTAFSPESISGSVSNTSWGVSAFQSRQSLRWKQLNQ